MRSRGHEVTRSRGHEDTRTRGHEDTRTWSQAEDVLTYGPATTRSRPTTSDPLRWDPPTAGNRRRHHRCRWTLRKTPAEDIAWQVVRTQSDQLSQTRAENMVVEDIAMEDMATAGITAPLRPPSAPACGGCGGGGSQRGLQRRWEQVVPPEPSRRRRRHPQPRPACFRAPSATGELRGAGGHQ